MPQVIKSILVLMVCLITFSFAAYGAEEENQVSGRMSVVKDISSNIFLEVDANVSQNPFATLGIGYRPLVDTSLLFELGGKKHGTLFSPMIMIEAEQTFHTESTVGEQELKLLFETEYAPLDTLEPWVERGIVLMEIEKNFPLEFGATIEIEGFKNAVAGPTLGIKIFETEVILMHYINITKDGGSKSRATAHYKF